MEKSNRFCYVNWDLAGCLHVVSTVSSDCFVHLFKGGSPRVVARSRARSSCSAFLFHSFSLRLFRQRKAAKQSWYQRLVCLCNAFFFGGIATKKKAPRTPKTRLRSFRGTPAAKKKWRIQGCSPRTLGRFLKKAPQKLFNRLVCANNVRDKSKFEALFSLHFPFEYAIIYQIIKQME